MLFIVQPLAFVLAAVDILEETLAVEFSMFKHSGVIFTVDVHFAPKPMNLSIGKLSLVLLSIRPEQPSNTILNLWLFLQPLAHILSAILLIKNFIRNKDPLYAVVLLQVVQF